MEKQKTPPQEREAIGQIQCVDAHVRSKTGQKQRDCRENIKWQKVGSGQRIEDEVHHLTLRRR